MNKNFMKGIKCINSPMHMIKVLHTSGLLHLKTEYLRQVVGVILMTMLDKHSELINHF